MKRTVGALTIIVLLLCTVWSAASASRMKTSGTNCTAVGQATWTPPINVSNIRPTAISHVATLTCRGGGVLIGALAGFLRSHKVACVAAPKTTPEAGTLTIQWNTGASSKISVRVTFVNGTGHQILSGKVTSGLFKGDTVKYDLQARQPQVGHCTDAAPLVSTSYDASVTL